MLNSDELERTDVIVIVFQAKLNDLAHTFHEGVESLGLGVTTAKGGNSGDVIACFVLLDQYGEFSFGLQARTLWQESLSRRGQAIVETGKEWGCGAGRAGE